MRQRQRGNDNDCCACGARTLELNHLTVICQRTAAFDLRNCDCQCKVRARATNERQILKAKASQNPGGSGNGSRPINMPQAHRLHVVSSTKYIAIERAMAKNATHWHQMNYKVNIAMHRPQTPRIHMPSSTHTCSHTHISLR